MSIIRQIINLNMAAMMGGTSIERIYVNEQELGQIFNATFPRPSIGEMEQLGGYRQGMQGYVDGAMIFLKQDESEGEARG